MEVNSDINKETKTTKIFKYVCTLLTVGALFN